MGLSVSCLDYGPLYKRFCAVFLALIGHGMSDQSGQTPILRALGSGKMLLERSLSLKRLEGDHKNSPVRKSSFKSLKPSSHDLVLEPTTPVVSSPKHEAATKLQKFYKSFRTRRQLADCAVIAEQHWWELLEFAQLRRSSVSFFERIEPDKPETVNSRWIRARMRAAKVGKGLSKDAKAKKLALQHWLEAIDPRHRYGHNLHFYYLNWLNCESKQPFFYWLDVGEGKEVNLPNCLRSKLQQQCIKYLGPKEREAYEVVVEYGKLVYKKSREILDTSCGSPHSKWIFVLSTSKMLYVGQKKKGSFQHSSFLAGGATSSAGRLVVEKGILKAVWPHSGHYRPTEENFLEFMCFLRQNSVDLTDVKKSPVEDEEDSSGRSSASSSFRRTLSHKMSSTHMRTDICENGVHEWSDEVQQLSSHDGSAHLSDKSSPFVSGGINELDIQNIYKGSEGETDEENDDNAVSVESAEVNDLFVSPMGTIHPIGDEAGEASSSSSVQSCSFHKKNLFEEDQDEGIEQSINKELLLQKIDSIKRTKPLQLARQWTSGVGPRIKCVRDYPSQLQFQALEQVNLSPRTKRHTPSSTSTPRTSACSTPRASGTSILKHYNP